MPRNRGVSLRRWTRAARALAFLGGPTRLPSRCWRRAFSFRSLYGRGATPRPQLAFAVAFGVRDVAPDWRLGSRWWLWSGRHAWDQTRFAVRLGVGTWLRGRSLLRGRARSWCYQVALASLPTGVIPSVPGPDQEVNVSRRHRWGGPLPRSPAPICGSEVGAFAGSRDRSRPQRSAAPTMPSATS